MSGLFAAFTGGAQAAPIEGDPGSNAAVVLLLLGVGALLMGAKNLRELRHKRLVPERKAQATGADPQAPDSKANG